MKRSLRAGLFLAAALAAVPLAVISVEKAVSYLLFKYAARTASKGSAQTSYKDNG